MKLHIKIIALLLIVSSASTQAQTTLMTKWETGERLMYIIEQTFKAKSEAGQKSLELQSSLKLDTTWEVVGALPDGDVKLNVSIDRVRYTADGKGAAAMIQDLKFDSDAKAEPQSEPEEGVAEVLSSYVGAVAAVAIDGRGRVSEFSLPDELSEKLKGTMARELAGFFGDLFTSDGLRLRLTNWLVAFPAEKISNGTTWSQVVPSRGGAKIAGIRNYELVGAVTKDADNFVQINVTPQLKARDANRFMITNKDGDGWVHLDPKTHKIKEFVLRRKDIILTRYTEQSFDLAYSVKLY
jgi:hypothetical protein